MKQKRLKEIKVRIDEIKEELRLNSNLYSQFLAMSEGEDRKYFLRANETRREELLSELKSCIDQLTTELSKSWLFRLFH